MESYTKDGVIHMKKPKALRDAVVLQIIDGVPIVSIDCRNEDKLEELQRFAHIVRRAL